MRGAARQFAPLVPARSRKIFGPLIRVHPDSQISAGSGDVRFSHCRDRRCEL